MDSFVCKVIVEKGQSGRAVDILANRTDPSRQKIREVSIRTGRLHQIRRHFDLLGYPVMGDPKYSRNNKNDAGMQFKAVRMAFSCPVTGEKKKFSL